MNVDASDFIRAVDFDTSTQAMSSIIPEAVAAGVWYHLARRGITTTTVW